MFDFNCDDTFRGFAPTAKPGEEKPVMTEAVFEAKAEEAGDAQLSADAMGIALTFVADGDYSAEYLEAVLIGFVDADEDEDLSEEEALHYEALAATLVEAFVGLGASQANAEAAVNGDDEAAAKLGDFLSGKLEDNPKSDSEIVQRFSVDGSEMVLEATKRVVRGGEVMTIKIPTRKRRLSSAQRAALKKARAKANTGAAKQARKKAMRIRKARGL